MESLITQIKNRQDSAENWSINNPVLANGEIGIEVDTNKFKIGDSIKHWNDLDYQGSTEETINVWETGTGEKSVQTKGTNCTAIGDYSSSEGYATMAKANYSHTEGFTTKTASDSEHDARYAHAEGYLTEATGLASHAEGDTTYTQNIAEHSEGRGNVSHKDSDSFGSAGNTIHSIGIGSNNQDLRTFKNAVEVMQNGDVYINGVGGYEGTDIDGAEVVVLESSNYSTLTDSMSTAVPTLTVQQVTDAYNAITAGKVVYIEDMMGNNRTIVLQKAPVDNEPTIYCSYLSRLELAYTIREVDNVETVIINFKEIGDGGTQKYQHNITISNLSGFNTKRLTFTISSSDSNAYTSLSQIAEILHLQGFTDSSHMICCSGFVPGGSSAIFDAWATGIYAQSSSTLGVWYEKASLATVQDTSSTNRNVPYFDINTNIQSVWTATGNVNDIVVPL